MKRVVQFGLMLLFSAVMSLSAWAQWSSDPAKNLALADAPGADQVQPKIKPLPNGKWYVSWFDADPNSPPPVGYSVYYQRLSPKGVEHMPHGGIRVAHLSNSSTEDYGLDADIYGNALLAFLDTREGANPQVTAAKMGPNGFVYWGPHGVQLTKGNQHSNASPKIAGTSDGSVVVAWISDSSTILQKLDFHGVPQWGDGVVLQEPGSNYWLADLHAADNGSVIVSWVRNQGFGSDSQLRANKLSASGDLLWGKNHVTIFDTGSLQFGNFPYFVPDGKGGAVFAWYTSSPTLQCYAQHIRSDGSEAFPHNGSEASINAAQVRVDPAASYHAANDAVFLVWTEEDGNQVLNGIYAQKFSPKGARRWGASGRVVVPLGDDSQILPANVQIGTGILAFWIDMPGFGDASIQATRLLGTKVGVKCPQFPVATARSNKGRPVADIVSASGLAAIAFEDDRIGSNGIYIQNVNRDCSLGTK